MSSGGESGAAARADVSISVACKTSPRNGTAAWGAVLRSGPHAKTVGGSVEPDAKVTPHAAAVYAIIGALRQLNRPCRLTLRTASHYVQQSLPKLARWGREGWTRADATGLLREPVPNGELWRALLSEIREGGHVVSEWVPVGGYRSYETRREGSMLVSTPVGPVVPRTDDDALAEAAAAAALRRALVARTAEDQPTLFGPGR